jgi:hypothetical protein
MIGISDQPRRKQMAHRRRSENSEVGVTGSLVKGRGKQPNEMGGDEFVPFPGRLVGYLFLDFFFHREMYSGEAASSFWPAVGRSGH